eukprot:TRINITY_DN25780_c0_g1_i1.p1 TRINITY_DN25780_c0_g1~~TRINITY_DN25780_c0_g1_i1.p1  ORF type:complete len:576 (-),score=63.90 TRINITY_DN25780_c0_g1_i1:55-1782(-)
MNKRRISKSECAGAYSLSSLWRKPDPRQLIMETEDGGLPRVLSVFELIGYGVASTVGAGIFVTIGSAASDAGPAVMVSFLLAGFSSLLSALCYSEFASRIPISGSAYSFAYVAMGEFLGWFVGWNLTLEYAISASTVARGWAGYMLNFCSQALNFQPWWLQDIPVFGGHFFSFSWLAAAIVLICTLILLRGVKESAQFNMVMTVINLIVILFVIIYASTKIEVNNWSNFFPNGVAGTWKAVGVVFFSYIGFDSVSTLAGEVARPERDLPIGIVGTLGIATALYVGVSLAFTGMINYRDIPDLGNAPLAQAFYGPNHSWAGYVVSSGSLTIMTATTLVSLVGQPRIFLQMAKDGLFFSLFGRVSEKTGTPFWGTVITGIVSGIIAAFFRLDSLTEMISIGTLLAFIVVCAGVVILRFRAPPSDQEDLRSMPGGEVYASTWGTWEEWAVTVYLTLFMLASLWFSIAFTFFKHLQPWSMIPTGLIVVLTFIPLQLQEVKDPPKTFTCPLVPFVPCLAILMNISFIVSLPIDSIIRLVIWTLIGMAIYFGYGIWNSKLNWYNVQYNAEHRPVKVDGRVN